MAGIPERVDDPVAAGVLVERSGGGDREDGDTEFVAVVMVVVVGAGFAVVV